jgi:hypothetical protein
MLRRQASKVAICGGLVGIDWIECRLWRSIRKNERRFEFLGGQKKP